MALKRYPHHMSCMAWLVILLKCHRQNRRRVGAQKPIGRPCARQQILPLELLRHLRRIDQSSPSSAPAPIIPISFHLYDGVNALFEQVLSNTIFGVLQSGATSHCDMHNTQQLLTSMVVHPKLRRRIADNASLLPNTGKDIPQIILDSLRDSEEQALRG